MTAATTPPFTFHIDIYVDTVCIWSYIGHKLLERAIETYKTALPPDDRDKVTFNLTWRPYVLYPNAGVSTRTKKEAIQKIYSLNAPEIFLRIDSLTKENNIPLIWQGTTGNSINSHKLILLATEQDSQSQSLLSSPIPLQNNSDTQPHQKTKQYQVVSTIFREAWQLSTDISAPSNLARIAVSTGLFPCEAKAASYLENSEAATEAVHASSAYGKSIGVSAVPSYVVNGRWQVGGMQDVDMWLELFGRIRHASSAST